MDLWQTCSKIQWDDNVLSVLEKAKISTLDLLMMDPVEISRKTSMTIEEVNQLISSVVFGCAPEERLNLDELETRFLTTGDPLIDRALSGGIPLGHVLEIAGESGTGKSQFCMQLCLTAQLPRALGGLERKAIYISTETGLSTKRLFQMAKGFSIRLHKQYPDANIRFDNLGDYVYCVNCVDLEEQDHILYFQLPVALARYNAGLVILDSITTHYRVEYDTSMVYRFTNKTQSNDVKPGLADLVNRSRDLIRLGAHLRSLAEKHQCAIIVINQVSDKIKSDTTTLLDLDYQGAWFQGWNHDEHPCKVPSLGYIWSNNIHARIVLLRSVLYESDRVSRSRALRIVFSPFCAPSQIDIDITDEGLFSIQKI